MRRAPRRSKIASLLLVLAALLACGLVLASAQPLPQALEMFAGDSRVLAAQPRRIAVGNGAVAAVSTLSSGELLIVAEKPGRTIVSIWLRDGGVHRIAVDVVETDLEHLLGNVRDLLRGAGGVSARIAGSRIVLEGTRASGADRRLAAAVATLHPGLVLDFVGQTGWEEMIHVDVKIVELRRSAVRDLGIRWDASIDGPSAGSKPQPFLDLTTAIRSRLALLETRGEARILAEPTLSCRSGGVARFVSGGEVPIPVLDALGGMDVEYKEYGVILDIKPVAEPGGAIYAQIDTEVSRLDASVRVLDVPAFLKRRSSTEVNVREGETIVIAGLVDRSRSDDVQQMPGLGSVPAAGRLFRSKSRRREESELVVLLTPRIVRGAPGPVAPDADPNADALRRLEQHLQELEKP
jgi:pilus assembly protein CpaC